MKTQCAYCGSKFKVHDKYAFKSVTCPKCKQKFLIIPADRQNGDVTEPITQGVKPDSPPTEKLPSTMKAAPGPDQVNQSVHIGKQPRKIGGLGIAAIALVFIACIVITVFITRLTGRITDDEINSVGSEVTRKGIESQPTSSLPESGQLQTESKPVSSQVSLVKKIQPAVVTVITYDKDNEPLGLGSGFFIDSSGLLITNYHVLDKAVSAEVTTHDGKIFPIKLVVAEDQDVDLIKVSVDIPGKTVNFVQLTNEVPEVAEQVMVIGSPLGLEQTVSEGIISAVRDIPIWGKIYQISAPISSGSSGSPVVNMRGEVIGVAFLEIIGGQNLNFAISAGQVLALKPEGKSKTLAEWISGVSQQEIDEAREFYTKGKEFLLIEEYEKSLNNFKKVVEKNPRYGEAWHKIGYCLQQLDRHLEAIEAYRQAISIEPNLAKAHYNLGIIYHEQGRYQEAIEVYLQAIRIEPDKAEAYYSMGNSYRKLGLYLESIKACQQAIRFKPDYAMAYYNLGCDYDELGFYLEAIEAYQQAIRIEPDKISAYLNMGRAYRKLTRYQESLEAYKEAIRIEPEKYYAHYNLGFAYFHLNRYQESIEAYKEAIRIEPEKYDAYYSLGAAYAELGRHLEAITTIHQAIRIEPEIYDGHYNLGYSYRELGRYQESIEAYKEAIRIEPDYPSTYYHLGKTYSKLVRHLEAIEVYKQAISILPEYAEAHNNLGIAYLAIGDKVSAMDEYKILKELDENLAKELFNRIYK